MTTPLAAAPLTAATGAVATSAAGDPEAEAAFAALLAGALGTPVDATEQDAGTPTEQEGATGTVPDPGLAAWAALAATLPAAVPVAVPDAGPDAGPHAVPDAVPTGPVEAGVDVLVPAGAAPATTPSGPGAAGGAPPPTVASPPAGAAPVTAGVTPPPGDATAAATPAAGVPTPTTPAVQDTASDGAAATAAGTASGTATGTAAGTAGGTGADEPVRAGAVPAAPAEPTSRPDDTELDPGTALAGPAAAPATAQTQSVAGASAAPAVAALQGSTPTEASPATEQVRPALVELARGLSQSGGTASLVIRLDPPELGPVLVRLTVTQGRVDVRLRAPEVEAVSGLSAANADVARVLAEHGLDLSTFEVDHGTLPGGERQQDRSAQRDQARSSDRGTSGRGGDADNTSDATGVRVTDDASRTASTGPADTWL